ncbi:Eukaryotic translation initiation factor 4 gamma 1 [Sarcoptes scabiei]|uniref:Eukaryotic translation initiation factor 4 gamma 1 n=1 Tax=Sarcoptes scabiei TaxID=52283 RepID=A0A834RBW8_SARSC|nr:Eukaryotic translation initiation factor 4 gamma 1 [Sarcoptes scabiei]
MSKQSVSKHRTGGSHGVQPQNTNTAHRPTDFTRSNVDRFQAHTLRQTATGGGHMQSGSINLQPQPAQNAMQQPINNSQLIRNYQNNPLIHSQHALNMSHVSNSQPQPPPPVMSNPAYPQLQPQSSLRITNPVPQQISYSFQAPNAGPDYQPDVPNYQPSIHPTYSPYTQQQFLPALTTDIFMRNHPNDFSFPMIIAPMNRFRFPYHGPPVNIQNSNINNAEINNPQQQVHASQVSQIQQNAIHPKKRKKKPLEVYTTEGELLNLSQLASEQSIDTPATKPSEKQIDVTTSSSSSTFINSVNSHENSKSNAAIIENEGGKIGDETLEDEKHKNAKTSHSLDKQTEQSIAETQCDPPSSHDVADSACNQSLVIDHSDIEKDLETRTFGEDCSKQNNLSGGDNKKMTHNQSRLESMVPKSENDHHHSDLDRDDRQAQDYSIKIKDQNPIALNNSNINPKQIETSDMDSVSENLESLKIAQKIEEHESIKQTPLLQIHPRGDEEKNQHEGLDNVRKSSTLSIAKTTTPPPATSSPPPTSISSPVVAQTDSHLTINQMMDNCDAKPNDSVASNETLSNPIDSHESNMSSIVQSNEGDKILEVSASAMADTSSSIEVPANDDAGYDSTGDDSISSKSNELKNKNALEMSPNDIAEYIEKDFKYHRDFLISLREKASKFALSNSNQDNLKDIIRKNNPSSSSDSLLPNFVKNRSQNDQFRKLSQIQPYSRRLSQPMRNFPDPKPRKIASTSLNENDWRPGKSTATNPQEIETENLLKNVRSILNKLTPQNYQTLLDQFRNLKIDSKDRLLKVIELIFEKAVREPAFVAQYAGFCSELLHINVMENETQVEFRVLLIERCQNTFYEEMYSDVQEMTKQAEETDDPILKKELLEKLDDEKRISRKRSVGNIKLIAELYKLNILSYKIMFQCFDHLLANPHDDYIECLCALITNIGKALTDTLSSRLNEMNKINAIFNRLTKIHNHETEIKVSPRIRFMILDLLDLRKNSWVPRRKVEGPKTIAQVHEDMEMQQRLKNESLNDLKKKKTQGGPQQMDEWQQVNNVKRKTHYSSVISKNLNLNILKDFSGNANRTSNNDTFSMFKAGSHGGSTSNSQSRSSSTNYDNKNQVFSSQNISNKSQRVFHDSLNSKNSFNRRDERKISDVSSQPMNRRNDIQSDSRSGSTNSLRSVLSNVPSSPPSISEEEFQEKIQKTVNDYLEMPIFSDIIESVNSYCSKSKYIDFIAGTLVYSIEKTSQKFNPRKRWGEFLGQFFLLQSCENADIFESLKNVYAQYEDIRLDVPKFFELIGETLSHALLTVHKNDKSRKDIFKTIAKSYNEITGNECTLFREALLGPIKEEEKSLYEELSSLFHSQSNSNADQFNKLNEFIKNFLVRNDLQEFVNEIEKNYSDSTDLENFKRALFYKLLDVSLESCQHDNSDSIHHNLSKIFNIIKQFVKSNKDQLLFLIECSTFWNNLNRPSSKNFSTDSNL